MSAFLAPFFNLAAGICGHVLVLVVDTVCLNAASRGQCIHYDTPWTDAWASSEVPHERCPIVNGRGDFSLHNLRATDHHCALNKPKMKMFVDTTALIVVEYLVKITWKSAKNSNTTFSLQGLNQHI
jgi:hypothetical protein